jgi:hypothetical protein
MSQPAAGVFITGPLPSQFTGDSDGVGLSTVTGCCPILSSTLPCGESGYMSYMACNDMPERVQVTSPGRKSPHDLHKARRAPGRLLAGRRAHEATASECLPYARTAPNIVRMPAFLVSKDFEMCSFESADFPSTAATVTAQAPLHLQSLPAPPPAIAPLHVRSLPSMCDRSPPPVIAPLSGYLRSLPGPSTCDPTAAPLRGSTSGYDQLPSTCDRCPSPAAFAPLHLQSESMRVSTRIAGSCCWLTGIPGTVGPRQKNSRPRTDTTRYHSHEYIKF